MRLKSILVALLFPLWLGCAANVDTDSEGEDGGTSSSDSGSTTESDTTTSSSATVSGLEDASGNALTSSSKVSTCPSFCAVFSAAIDTATCTTSTLTLSCNGTAVTGGTVVIPSDTDGISDNECCLNPVCPIPQASSCTFTVSGVKDKNGSTVGSGTVSVTTNCRSSDDFSANSASCYSFKNTTNQTNSIENTKTAALTISDGSATFDMNTNNSQFETSTNAALGKEVSGDFDLQVTVKSMFVDNNNANIKLLVQPKSAFSGGTLTNAFSCGFHRNHCHARMITAGTLVMNEDDAACDQGGSVPGSFGPNLSLRVVKSGSTYKCYRKLSNGSFTQIGADQTNTSLSGETNFIGLHATSYSTSGDTSYTVDDWTFNSGSVTGQDSN